MLQPNIQEREFRQYAPTLEGLDPSTVRQWYINFCRVAPDYGIYVPAYEEFRPEETFLVIECGDTPTARVPKFCQSQVPRWEAIIHHHLKHDKVIPVGLTLKRPACLMKQFSLLEIMVVWLLLLVATACSGS